jgi:hypothetical protein
MKISTLDKTVAVLLKDFFFIPRFQRPYSWEKEQVEQFWRDTVVENTADYFIGSVVLYEEDGSLGIVDGQQRITTIVMLLAALRDAFDENNLGELAKGLQEILEKRDVENRKRFALRTETSFPYLQDKILRHGKSVLVHDPGAEEKALQWAFDFLGKQIAEATEKWAAESKPENRIETILRSIRDKILALKLISVDLENEDDAYIIFETLNTRGKDLQVSHLLKNLFARLLKPTNKDLDPVKEKWTKVLGTFEASQVEIDADVFLHHFWLSRAKYVTATKMFADMKHEIMKSGKAKEVLDDLIADAPIYRTVVEPGFGKWKKDQAKLRDSLAALSVFRVQQPYPLVLSIMRAYKGGLSKKNAQAMLWAIERFHFTFTAIGGQSSSGGISLMYARWARDLYVAHKCGDEGAVQRVMKEIISELAKKGPPRDDFIAGFKALRYSDQLTKQKRLVQYILRKISDHQAHGGVAIDHTQMTIEHVAPQNPSSPPGVSEEHVAMLGNLLWCDSELQGKLDNKKFSEKVAVLKDSNVSGKDRIIGNDKWGEAEIEKRTAELAALAFDEVWA